MRLAIIATPALLADQRPAPGALDGDVLRARLPAGDTDFEVVDLDPDNDLAEQLDALLEARAPAPGDPVFFYASSLVAISEEGEFFLCLQPGTGDALSDIVEVLAARARGPVLVALECRHAPDPEDPFFSATVVAAGRSAVSPQKTGVELLIAARPLVEGAEERPSPFTRALIEGLDDADPAVGLTGASLYDQIQESEKLLGVVPCFAHARGRHDVVLVAGSQAPAPRPAIAPPAEPEASHPEPELLREPEQQPAPEPAPDAPAPPLEANAAPGPAVAAFRSAHPVAPPDPEPPPSAGAKSVPPTALPEERSFRKVEAAPLPKVILSDRPPPPSAPPPTPRPLTVADHLGQADRLIAAEDDEAALAELKKALGLLGTAATAERADIYVRIGNVKRRHDKRREAISNFEKALHIAPSHAPALEALIDLNVTERDWRAVQSAEERLLATIDDPKERSRRLSAFGDRWRDVAGDDRRAEQSYEQARELEPNDLALLGKLLALHEAAGRHDEAIVLLRRQAELTTDPRERARLYFELAQRLRTTSAGEDAALVVFEKALDAEPTLLEPLEIIASILAERQDWGDLELAYRRMLERLERFPKGPVRTEVTWELCRRLGLLFRDHLEDPALALDAFEDAVEEKPDDLAGHLTAAELAKKIGKLDRAAVHLQAVAMLEPTRHATYGELFEVFQKLRRPDEAYAAACVSMFLRTPDARQRFVFEEHKPDGVPKLRRPLRPEAWDLVRVANRDLSVEAILAGIAPAAIAARLARMEAEKKLPVLDPRTRQDPEKSTATITRSFTWASHFFGIAAPAVYVREDSAITLAAVPVEEPSVIAGAGVLRGHAQVDLAFLVGRHLAYYVGSHRLLLYYPSLEDISACFVAGVLIASPTTPIPAQLRDRVGALLPEIEARLGPDHRARVIEAVRAFETEGRRADLGAWASAVERCATRAGYLLCADLSVVMALLRTDTTGLVEPEEKIADLLGFIVSDEHHTLRQELGVAIEP